VFLQNSSPDLPVVNSVSFIPLRCFSCLSNVTYRAVQICCTLSSATGLQQTDQDRKIIFFLAIQ